MTLSIGFDIGSNSVGSASLNHQTGEIIVGLSVFPAGVDESDEKRGDPKNAKRRMTRRTRITLARRSQRKRDLRLKLIESGLLPTTEAEFKKLLDTTDAWELRRKGLRDALTPHEFGRVLLHLAQRRGALGLKIADDEDEVDADDGKVKAAIHAVRAKMKEKNAATFGEYMAMKQAERITPITATPDQRKEKRGPREFRSAIRNKAASYEHCADRSMIRDEFAKLWDKQKSLGGPLAAILSDELRAILDNESGNSVWRHKGLLFGQRRQSWDLGTLGRCVLEPTERCAPHADMDASRYLVVETVNNLKIIEWGREPRPLTSEEREKIKLYLSSPLGMEKGRKKKGDTSPPADRPKSTVSATDLRNLMGTSNDGWGRATKSSRFLFNIEADEERHINTDWFNREIVHGAVGHERWLAMSENQREGINRALLKHDQDQDSDAAKLRTLVMQSWAGLSESQADALVTAWKRRPRLDAKRLNMSRRAVRNLLPIMDGGFVNAQRAPGEVIEWFSVNEHEFDPAKHRWPTQVEARIIHADRIRRKLEQEFQAKGSTPEAAQKEAMRRPEYRRYATGAKGATARDRHYIKKHLLKKNGQPIYGPDGLPLHEPPPAPLISNPVTRKAIHEVRRHIVNHLSAGGRKPDSIYVELSRETRMGKVESDKLLFRNRLRNRIRNDIIQEMNLGAQSSTQQRAAVDRVILAVHQNCVCPLCGKTLGATDDCGITLRTAAIGTGCEVAHIIPKGSGGHNGLGNIVLAHEKCNRLMDRRTPRQYWEADLQGGFEEGLNWVEKIYGAIERPFGLEMKSATGNSLWKCYFDRDEDKAKIERFKKNITDIQGMTARQDAATKYATRQVMAYLSDALFSGDGLPERGGNRLIFATDGMWTSRLRREWGLGFDPHEFRLKGLTADLEQERKEKDRGDHRHHAIDAIVIACCTRQVQLEWENREKAADKAGINTANEEQLKNYRKEHPISVPAPFRTREAFREAVKKAVYGEELLNRPVSHRAVKRKLIGAFHEETLFGPVLDKLGKLTGNYTAKKSVLQLDPNHLRMPVAETPKESIQRLTDTFKAQGLKTKQAKERAEKLVNDPNFRPWIIDPPPGKSGIVRDIALRKRIRDCLSGYEYVKRNKLGEAMSDPKNIDPDDFMQNEIKKAFEDEAICHLSGVPIRSVVLLRTMSDPVVIDRKRPDYTTNKSVRDQNPASQRAYVGGNNHHIEIRAAQKKKGGEDWSGEVVTGYQAGGRKLARLRAARKAGVPNTKAFRKLAKAERAKWKETLRAIEKAHPIVDRNDNDAKGGRFIMSLCEGEMLLMRHKETKEVGYFVVAKLDKPQGIVLVPHWDARPAGERKNDEGKKIPNSGRDQFTATPNDLRTLAPPGHDHAVKVRVSPLGHVSVLRRD